MTCMLLLSSLNTTAVFLIRVVIKFSSEKFLKIFIAFFSPFAHKIRKISSFVQKIFLIFNVLYFKLYSSNFIS